jgi:hypothetical protein
MEAYSHFINLREVLSDLELSQLNLRAAEAGRTLKELLFENIPALTNDEEGVK